MSVSEIRLRYIREQLIGITQFPERPPEGVLKAVSQLHGENFSESIAVSDEPSRLTWTKVRTPISPCKQFNTELNRNQRTVCSDFFVAKVGDFLKVQVLLPVTVKRVTKTGRHALYICMHTSDPRNVSVTAVFRWSLVQDRAPEAFRREIAIRERFNASDYFPKLLSWGTVDGTTKIDSKSKKCLKIIAIEHLYMNIDTFVQKFPRYFDTPHRVEHMVRDLLCQLTILHKNNIVHCDLKPDNLLIKPSADPNGVGQFMFTDFGLSKEAGMEVGINTTADHCPPEIVKFYYNYDSRAAFPYETKYDLWEIGVLAARCLQPQSTPAYRETQYKFIKLLSSSKPSDDEKKALYIQWNKELTEFLSRVFFRHPDKPWLKALLQRDPAQRLSAESVLQLLPKRETDVSATVIEELLTKLSLSLTVSQVD